MFRSVRRTTLARASLAGGATREILDHVQVADWAPNGKDLAVVHSVDGRNRLEYPIGTVLYEEPAPGSITHVRVSPKGDMIAFIDHPPVGGFDPRGSVAVVDLAGKKRTLTDEWICALGLAWSPGGDEVWFTASEKGYLQSLRAVTLSGQQRLITQMTGMLLLHDIARDGRVLLARETVRTQAICLPPDESTERDLSWFDEPFIHDISPDGKTILFDEEGEGGGANGTVYVRKTNGSPAVRLGDGFAIALSPDGNWALTRLRNTTPPQFVLLPTGVGQPKPLPPGTIISQEAGSWFPDGKRILFIGNEPNHNLRAYVQNIDTGETHPLTPEGLAGTILSPDGKSIIASKRGEKNVIVSIDTGETRPIPGLTDEDNLARWSADGRSLYLFQGKMPMKLYRLDLTTGRRELLKEIVPSDPAGAVVINEFPLVTPDGKSYAYTLERELCELYIVEGLK